MDNFTEYAFWFFVNVILTVVLITIARLHGRDFLVLRNSAKEQQYNDHLASALRVHARWRFLLATILLIGASGSATAATMLVRLAVKSW